MPGSRDGAVEADAGGSETTGTGEPVGVGEQPPVSSASSIAPVSAERSLIGPIPALGSPTFLEPPDASGGLVAL